MAEPLHVKKLTTNLKTAGGVTVEMGPRVLIVGPNESGKSAIAQSLLLATTGATSGLLLRKGSVRVGEQISTMLPANEARIEIRAELSNGDVAIFECEPGHKPKHSKPSSLGIGVDEVREAFSGSPDTAKKFLVNALITVNIATSEVYNELKTDSLKDLFNEVIGDRKTLTGGGFIELMDSVLKTQKAYKTRASGAATVVNLLGQSAQFTATRNMEVLWENSDAAVFAQWFKDQGKSLQTMTEEDRPAALGPLRWLSKTLGGKDALAAAKPKEETRNEIEAAIAGKAIFDFVKHTQKAASVEEEQAESYKRLYDALLEYFDLYLSSIAIDTFVERASHYLPPDEKLVIDSDKMYFGLSRRGESHYALSGSTEARVLAAMCCALNGPGKLSIVVVDDRMWDGMTLAKTLKALEKAPCMVVMMSTMLPRGRARASWTFIELAGSEEPTVPKGAVVEKQDGISDNSPATAAEADGVSPETADADFGFDFE
jgi:energy-coupling factor transporter ATP-binding protein EcfA2